MWTFHVARGRSAACDCPHQKDSPVEEWKYAADLVVF